MEQGASANPFLLFLLFVLIVLWLIKFKRSESTRDWNLPPSPPKLPFIGNLHQLHGLPHHVFGSLSKKYGPLMLLHLGQMPTLVISSSETARDVLKTYDHVFSSRPELLIPNRLLYGKDIAFAPYGEYWRDLRKVCVLKLLSAKKVLSFKSVREEEISLMVEKMQESSSLSQEVNLSEVFALLTNSTICRAALGRKYSEDEGGRKFKEMLKEFTYLLGVFNVGDLLPSLAWVNGLNGLNARVEKIFKELDSFLNQVVEEHEQKRRNGGDSCDGEDFVDVMLGIPLEKDATKAVIMDMFAAGTDTTSVVLEWAMSELIRHPSIMEEVQKEVRDLGRGKTLIKEDDIQEMHYLKAVIKETLRMHPPNPLLVIRESIDHTKMHGYDIPGKTKVMVNAFAIGRDPMWWEEPNKFWPKRFLNGGSDLVDLKGQDFNFIPFGGGRRGCPGFIFATALMGAALANLLNQFSWALPNGLEGTHLNMDEDFGITTRRKNALIVRARAHCC